jgi:hypothetical protein
MIVSIRKRSLGICAALLMMGMAACSAPSEPVKIVAVDLTHEVDEHNEARSARETFAPTSTIYASIATEGTGKATLTAKWTDPSGAVLADESQDINPTKPQHFEFHIPPAEGHHPLGRYKVALSLNGGSTRTREFEIRVTTH